MRVNSRELAEAFWTARTSIVMYVYQSVSPRLILNQFSEVSHLRFLLKLVTTCRFCSKSDSSYSLHVGTDLNWTGLLLTMDTDRVQYEIRIWAWEISLIMKVLLFTRGLQEKSCHPLRKKYKKHDISLFTRRIQELWYFGFRDTRDKSRTNYWQNKHIIPREKAEKIVFVFRLYWQE